MKIIQYKRKSHKIKKKLVLSFNVISTNIKILTPTAHLTSKRLWNPFLQRTPFFRRGYIIQEIPYLVPVLRHTSRAKQLGPRNFVKKHRALRTRQERK